MINKDFSYCKGDKNCKLRTKCKRYLTASRQEGALWWVNVCYDAESGTCFNFVQK